MSKSFASASANCRGDDRPRTMPAKPTRTGDSPIRNVKQRPTTVVASSTVPGNITRHFVRTMSGGHLSSPESPYVNHQQAIRNYLNQTLPVPARQHTRPRDRAPTCQAGRAVGPVDRRTSFVADAEILGDRLSGATRGQGGKLQPRHSVDGGCVVRRKLTACDASRYLDSHSQRHGVIAASVYKELCNGTIGW